jgi:ribonuclease Y
MPPPGVITLLVGIILLIIGVVVGYFVGFDRHKKKTEATIQSAELRAAQIISEAEAQGKELVLKGKDETIQLREETEKEMDRRRRDLQRLEERVDKRQEQLDRRSEQVEQREKRLNQRQSTVDKRFKDLEKMESQHIAELERISALTQEEAKQILLKSIEQDTRQDMAKVIRAVEAEATEEAERRARRVIIMAMERLASDQVSESTVSAVALPTDEMKGRIIGRQGRNIRAIEAATGVDLVVDDTPEAIIISSFDPVRREVARLALTKLVQDGRIHPTRIEKEVEKAREEVERAMREAGDQAAIETGLQGLHPEILKLVGRLKFRTSYGQNQYYHAIETSHLAGMIATELGADVKVAKMGGLLHDLGKAVSHEVEGPHALVGAEIAKRYGVPPKAVNCIAAHHNEVEAETLETIIVATADAISGARPGARREALETYVKRLTALEEIANSFEGVSESFAIQAGREIRVVVRPDSTDDMAAIKLSRDIAKKVEDNLEYPGQIKITVIREMRAVDYAK